MPNKTNPPDVLTLSLLSVLTGMFLSLLVVLVALLLEVPKPLAWAGMSFAVVAAATWLHLLGSWRSHHYPPADIPEAERVKVDILDRSGEYLEGQFLDLPIDYERMVEISSMLERGAKLGHSLAGPRGIISRAEFENLRTYFLTNGLARWINPRAPTRGVDLTAKGRALVRVFAAQSPAKGLQIKKKS